MEKVETLAKKADQINRAPGYFEAGFDPRKKAGAWMKDLTTSSNGRQIIVSIGEMEYKFPGTRLLELAKGKTDAIKAENRKEFSNQLFIATVSFLGNLLEGKNLVPAIKAHDPERADLLGLCVARGKEEAEEILRETAGIEEQFSISNQDFGVLEVIAKGISAFTNSIMGNKNQ